MNNIKDEMTYEEMMKGLDPQYIYANLSLTHKYFETKDGQPIPQGDIEVAAEYKSLIDAKKKYNKLKSHMYNKKLTLTHSVKIRNRMTNNKAIFVVAVCRLTDEDMKKKAKLVNMLLQNRSRRKND